MSKKFLYVIMVLSISFASKAQQTITSINTTYHAAAGSTYTIPGDANTYNFGANAIANTNNLYLNSFNIGANNYTYLPIYDLSVNFRRVNNTAVGYKKNVLYFEGSKVGNTINCYAGLLDQMSLMFKGNRNLYVGTDNLFANSNAGGALGFNNIERMDIIFPRGIKVTDLTKAGFPIFERGGNDKVKVAVITGIDKHNIPTEYTPAVAISNASPNHWGTTSLLTNRVTHLLDKNQTDSYYKFATTASSQGAYGVFLPFSSFTGLTTNTIIYGYSLLANDFNGTAAQIVDYTNATFFPPNATTGATNGDGALDPMCITGVFKLGNVVIFQDLDIDDDDDGIPDLVESFGLNATGDHDGDEIPNYRDADYTGIAWIDVNNDGINDNFDSDLDGIINQFDRDSDNDGIPDLVESGGVDTNGDGMIDYPWIDTNNNGLMDTYDPAVGGINLTLLDLNGPSVAGGQIFDFDGDGTPNYLDLDSDNDGIPDIREAGGADSNNDGRVDNSIDMDEDGIADIYDGYLDHIENPNTSSRVLILTGVDNNADGMPDNYLMANSDKIGLPNFLDLDSDGDGIVDAIEAGFSQTVTVINGLVSGARTNGWANSVRSLTSGSLSLLNTDNRGPADYLDIDSDDDGMQDNIEGQPTLSFRVASDLDSDGDGLSDVYDTVSGAFGGNGITPFDADADGLPDYRDSDSDNDGAPDINEASGYASLTQFNINTNDTDGDGLLDEFDVLNINTLTVGTLFKNVSNSNLGPSGDYEGPMPSGSNVTLSKSEKTGDRNYRTSVTLPLHIIQFNCTLTGKIATASWTINNEQAVDYYLVERSFNGSRFEPINKVMASNQNSFTYNIDDNLSQQDFTIVYYRIRQVSKTGEQLITNVILLKVIQESEMPLSIYPNPISSYMNIKFYANEKGTARMYIFEAAGKMLMTEVFAVKKGQNIFQINNLNALSSGMLMLKVQLQGQVKTAKLIKQ